MAQERVRRFETLDSWRGICAVLVALYHFPPIFYLSDTPIIRSGWRFVDFFFVLSGFVITHGYGNRITDIPAALDFVRKRFLRLYPLHLFTFLLFLVWIVSFDTTRLLLSMKFDGFHLTNMYQNVTPQKITAHLLLLQGFQTWEQVGFNIPSWSISVEFWTYIVFGCCCLLALKHLLLSQIILAVTTLWLLYILSGSSFYDNALRSVAGLSTGSIAYLLLIRIKTIPFPRAGITAMEAASIALMATFLWLAPVNEPGPTHQAGLAWLSPLVFVLVVVVFALEGGAFSDLLKGQIFRRGGAYSYSLYMDHALIISTVKIALDATSRVSGFRIEAPSFMGTILAVLFVVVLWRVSRWTYEWIELPGQQLFTRGAAPIRPRP
jgi:peptidoglycan/LPS O-acetylase OafA/YrhL